MLSLKLYSIQIPYTWYTFDENLGNNFFLMGGDKIELPSGNYTSVELVQNINGLVSDVDFSFNTNSGKIFIENTGSDISFIFYDSNSTEFTQTNSKYSIPPKLNYNLGWSMGFRPDYSNTNSTDISYTITSGSTLTAEAIADTYGTKYVLPDCLNFRSLISHYCLPCPID